MELLFLVWSVFSGAADNYSSPEEWAKVRAEVAEEGRQCLVLYQSSDGMDKDTKEEAVRNIDHYYWARLNKDLPYQQISTTVERYKFPNCPNISEYKRKADAKYNKKNDYWKATHNGKDLPIEKFYYAGPVDPNLKPLHNGQKRHRGSNS